MGPDVTVLARIDAKPHQSAIDEVVNLLLSDKIEQNLVVSDDKGSGTIDNSSSSNSGSYDGWTAKRRKHNDDSSSEGNLNQGGVFFNVAVAVKQNNILATAFHPELTNDLRWHRYVQYDRHHCKYDSHPIQRGIHMYFNQVLFVLCVP